jgi:predicted transcriptional regulator
MTVGELAEQLELEKLTGETGLDRQVAGGYASDLLSDVMARAEAGDVWVTLQTHRNIIAVATLKELAAVVLVNARMPDPDTLEAALRENLPVLRTQLPAFEVAGRLYQTGVRGTR